MAVAQSLSIVGFAFVTPFLPLYIQTLGIHGTTQVTLWAAMLSGFVAIGMAIASPIWGVLADRYGRKMMVVRAMGSAAVLIALMGLVTSATQLLVLRLLAGLLTGTVSASQALVASQSPKQRLGFSLGIMQTAVFTGNSLGPLCGGLIAELLGFRPTFGIAGGMLFFGCVLVAVFVHEDRPKKLAEGIKRPPFFAGMRQVLFLPALLPVIGSIFAVQFAITQVFPILPQYVQMLQGAAAGNAALATGIILAAAGAAGAISSTTVGWYSDRVGHKRVLAAAALAAACISIPQAFVLTTWQLGILRVFDGFALGAMLPSASAILAGLVPVDRRATAYGLSAAAVSLGFAAGPLTSAGIVAVSGIRAVFISAAILLAFVSLWVVITVPGRPLAIRAISEPTARKAAADGNDPEAGGAR